MEIDIDVVVLCDGCGDELLTIEQGDGESILTIVAKVEECKSCKAQSEAVGHEAGYAAAIEYMDEELEARIMEALDGLDMKALIKKADSDDSVAA